MGIEVHRDEPWQLPASWVWVPLGHLGRWSGGGTPSKSNSAFWADGAIPWVSPKDMKRDTVGDTVDRITDAAVQSSSTKLVPANSVLMVVRSGILNHTFPVAVSDRDVTLNQDMRALIPGPDIDARYLMFAIRRLQHTILRDCSKDGTTVASIESSRLENVLIPLAPSAEQKRIVGRIDELFTDIADGEAALARAREDLDTWRRALLKAAVTGELTREWRREVVRRSTADELLIRSITQNGSKKRPEAENSSPGLEQPALPLVPPEWAWARLSQLGDFGRGKSRHRPRNDPKLYGGTTPFIQTGNVSNCEDYIIDFNQTYSDAGIRQSKIWPRGTLCITIAANIAMTGILTFDACFPDSIVGLTPAPGVNAYYLHLWMQHIQAHLEAFAPATAQRNINLEILERVAVPLPPTAEQDRIVEGFQTAITQMIDGVRCVENSPQRERFRQAILKAAFEGRLIAQDPADVPAQQMLRGLDNPISTQHPHDRSKRRRPLAAE